MRNSPSYSPHAVRQIYFDRFADINHDGQVDDLERAAAEQMIDLLIKSADHLNHCDHDYVTKEEYDAIFSSGIGRRKRAPSPAC